MTQQQSTHAYIAWDACQESFRGVGDKRAGHPLNCARLMPRLSEEVFPLLPADAPWGAIQQAQGLATIIHARYGMNHNIAIWSDPDVLNFVPVATDITHYLDALITDAEWGLETKSQGPPLWKVPLMMGTPNWLVAALFVLPGIASALCSLMALFGKVYVLAVLLVIASLLAWTWLVSWLLLNGLSEKEANNYIGPERGFDGRAETLPTSKY